MFTMFNLIFTQLTIIIVLLTIITLAIIALVLSESKQKNTPTSIPFVMTNGGAFSPPTSNEETNKKEDKDKTGPYL
jgi:hypothetical protein